MLRSTRDILQSLHEYPKQECVPGSSKCFPHASTLVTQVSIYPYPLPTPTTPTPTPTPVGAGLLARNLTRKTMGGRGRSLGNYHGNSGKN